VDFHLFIWLQERERKNERDHCMWSLIAYFSVPVAKRTVETHLNNQFLTPIYKCLLVVIFCISPRAGIFQYNSQTTIKLSNDLLTISHIYKKQTYSNDKTFLLPSDSHFLYRRKRTWTDIRARKRPTYLRRRTPSLPYPSPWWFSYH